MLGPCRAGQEVNVRKTTPQYLQVGPTAILRQNKRCRPFRSSDVKMTWVLRLGYFCNIGVNTRIWCTLTHSTSPTRKFVPGLDRRLFELSTEWPTEWLETVPDFSLLCHGVIPFVSLIHRPDIPNRAKQVGEEIDSWPWLFIHAEHPSLRLIPSTPWTCHRNDPTLTNQDYS